MDEDYGFYFDRTLLWKIPLGIFVFIYIGVAGYSWLLDQGVFVQKTGTAYVGQPAVFDGKSYYCSHVTRARYCDEWEDVADSATDVAEAFGQDMFGIAKGEAPLIEGVWYAPFANMISSTVFSFSVDMKISIFAALMVFVLLSGTVLIVGGMFLTRAWPPFKTVLALYVLPGYVSFLSLSTLTGGAGMVIMVHCLFGPMAFILVALNIAGGLNIGSFSTRSADGAESKGFAMGKPASNMFAPPPPPPPSQSMKRRR